MSSSCSYNNIRHNVEGGRSILYLDHYSMQNSLREGHLFEGTACASAPSFLSPAGLNRL